MTAAGPQQPQPGGTVEVDRAIRRAELAKRKFDEELAGLIDDLHEAREAIREDHLPGEGPLPPRDDARGGR